MLKRHIALVLVSVWFNILRKEKKKERQKYHLVTEKGIQRRGTNWFVAKLCPNNKHLA